jgi:endonuclease-3
MATRQRDGASRPEQDRASTILTPEDVERFFEKLAALNPKPATELRYHDPFTLLVAVVLSAQSTDAGVNRATRELFRHARTPAEMIALGEEGIAWIIRTLGLYRTKAKNLVALSRLLLERHGGAVPRSREALEALPGVGRKTANVVLNEAFGEPTIAVDTHVFRVANRTGLAVGRTPREVEATLARIVPERFRRGAHHWLILLGRYICKARRPECWRCPVADLCRFPNKMAAPAASARVDRSVRPARKASAARG